MKQNQLKKWFSSGDFASFMSKSFKSETTSFLYFPPITPRIKNFWTIYFKKWEQKDH